MNVYVMSAGPEMQKVGITSNLNRRRAQITAATQREIVDGFHGITPKAREVEREIHRRLWHSRCGGEWFTVPLAVAEEAFDAAWEHVHGEPIGGSLWGDPLDRVEWKAP